jgi:hypothetical protein
LRTQGDETWRGYPSFLEQAVPRILDLFRTLELTSTIFVVGRDVELPLHHDLFAAIRGAGHELGNHSYDHSANFHLASAAQVTDEIYRTESAIEAIGGRRPVGFRGPSFRLSREILETLSVRNYRYDASTFPTFIGPLSRAYLLARSRLSRTEKADARNLFGTFRDGLRPLASYRWDIGGKELCEIPVTTFPIVRTPIHLTYINFIADASPLLAKTYLMSALKCAQMSRISPSLLLHATDFIGINDANAPKFLPGMKRTSQQKIDFLRGLLEEFSKNFNVMTREQYVATVTGGRELKSYDVAHYQ